MNEFKIIDSYHNNGEIIISQEQELRDVLHRMLKYGTRVVLLESPDSGVLTLGIGTPYGFAEYMNEDGNPPYLVATGEITNKVTGSYIEFDSGGTPTPIPVHKCLPFDRVVDIAVYFFRNKELPDYVSWEEL